MVHQFVASAGAVTIHTTLTGNPWLDLAIIVTIVAGALAALGAATRRAWRLGQSVHHLVDNLLGVPERDGVPARPGVMASLYAMDGRLKVIEDEMKPNAGGSMKDAIVAIRAQVGETRAIAVETRDKLDDHLRQTAGRV